MTEEESCRSFATEENDNRTTRRGEKTEKAATQGLGEEAGPR